MPSEEILLLGWMGTETNAIAINWSVEAPMAIKTTGHEILMVIFRRLVNRWGVVHGKQGGTKNCIDGFSGC